MEIVKTKRNAVLKVLITLGEALEQFEKHKDSDLYKMSRDSIIQRFEYSIDSFWKFLKLYLQEKHSLSIDNPTPRIVFRESLNAGLISQEEYDMLIDGITQRNLTSHSYNEPIAEQLAHYIPQSYVTMMAIANRLQP